MQKWEEYPLGSQLACALDPAVSLSFPICTVKKLTRESEGASSFDMLCFSELEIKLKLLKIFEKDKS